MLGGLDAVKYILKRKGCLHPFMISRILALSEILYYKDHGKRMTNTTYVAGPGTFYIENLKELLNNDSCFEKKEGDPERGIKSCIQYTCPFENNFDEQYRKYLDKAIEMSMKMDDIKLNELVVNDPVFNKITVK